MLNLHDKVAIITGAGSGIGRATAVLFTHLGALLTLVDKSEAGLNETAEMCHNAIKSREKDIIPHYTTSKREIVNVVGHIEDVNVLKRVVEETMKIHAKLNILVNNAGVFITDSDLLDMNIEDYDKLMNINTRAPLILTKMCAPHLIDSKGCIVNVSSVAGTHACVDSLPYAMSKAALDQFTKCIALELAEHGVRVNSVNPGHVRTSTLHAVGFSEKEADAFYDMIAEKYPLGRVACADEIANTIAFLASDMSSFTTGQLIHIDGGLSRTTAIVETEMS